MIQSDHAITGKFYKKLNSFVAVQNPSQSSPTFGSFDYFGSSIMFKNCNSFKSFLESKHPGAIFKVSKENDTI